MTRTTLTFLCATVAAPAAYSQLPSAVLREGDALGGGQIVTVINEPAVNQLGGYAATVNSSDGVTTLSHAWGAATEVPGALLFSEQTSIAGYDQTAWEAFFGIDNTAAVGYSPTCNVSGGGATGLDCAWVNGFPIAVEGQPIPPLPGKVYRFNSRVGMTGTGLPYWIGGINDAGGTNEGEGLFIGAGPTLVIKTGDAAPPPIVGNIGDCDFDVRYSAAGTHWIMNCDTTAATTADEWLLIDGTVATCAGGGLVGEGQVVPAAAGGNGVEAWSATFGSLGINEAGNHAYEADTTAATTADGVIVHNGVIRWREGQVVDGLTLTGAPLATSLNETNEVAFNWSTTGGIEAIFVEGELVAKEGDTVDWTGDGVADAGFVITDITGTTVLALGPRAANGDLVVYFTADVQTNGAGVFEGFFRVRLFGDGAPFCFGTGAGTPCPCGNNGAAGNGCANSLNANGGNLTTTGVASISADTLVLVGSGMPNSSCLYFQGTAQLAGGLGAVFGDGLRCAGGSVIRLGTKSNVGGASQYPAGGDQPVSVRGLNSAGNVRTYQAWYRNADPTFCTASTFNLTNGWELTWAP